MYTQIEKSKTSQLKANIPEKFLKDFSTYKSFPDGAKNENITEGENISLNLTTASQLQTFFEKKKRKDRKETKTFVKKNLVLDACLRRHDTYKGSFNSSSTFLPATGCVKENEKQDKKTPAQLNSNQKLDLIKKAIKHLFLIKSYKKLQQ